MKEADRRHTGLDAIWPRVRSEIAVERRRAARRRASLSWAAGVGALAAFALAVGPLTRILALRPAPATAEPWELADIRPVAGLRSGYPIVRGSRLLAVQRADGLQRVVCLDRRTGRVLWGSRLRFKECRLAADDRRVYVLALVPAEGWRCEAMDEAGGAALWSCAEDIPTVAPSLAMSALGPGVCWSRGGQLVLRDGATGALKWTVFPGQDEALSDPVELDGCILAASERMLFAVDAGNGALRWRCSLSDGAHGWPAGRPFVKAAADKVFVACRGMVGKGVLRCVEANTHTVLWARETPAPMSLGLDGTRVYLRSQTVVAYEPRSGAALWTAPVGGCGPVTIQGDRLYVVGADGGYRMMALDAGSGRAAWSRAVASSCTGVAVDGHMGFVSGNDGRLRAIALEACGRDAAASASKESGRGWVAHLVSEGGWSLAMAGTAAAPR